MIIARTPLRISLGGGGTDIPSFYCVAGEGHLVAATIDKYIYVAVHDNFDSRYLLKYSQVEDVARVEDIRHLLIRETLVALNVQPGIEVTSFADIPAGTGLGSSGAFAVTLIKALDARSGSGRTNAELAELACEIEIERLGEPVGKQDQFATAVGGLTSFSFRGDGSVSFRRLGGSSSATSDFEDCLMLFFTGIRRSASDELRALQDVGNPDAQFILDNLYRVRELGYESCMSLENGNIDRFGQLLTLQWELKRERSPTPVHREVDSWIRAGIANGAIGGKLVGAGGGGFLLFMAHDRRRLRKCMGALGLAEVPVRLDVQGSTLVAS